MQDVRFVVKYIVTGDCFVHVSHASLKRLKTEGKVCVIKAVHHGKNYYFSCIPRVISDEELCIGAIYAQRLNIQEGDEVFVSSTRNVPTLNKITIVPVKKSDYELLVANLEKIQSTLLNYVIVVAMKQSTVMWISKYSTVDFITVDLKPKCECGVLKQLTEIYVLEKAVQNVGVIEKKIKENELITKMRESMTKIFPHFLKEEDDRDSQTNTTNELLKRYQREAHCKLGIYRVCPNLRWNLKTCNLYDTILLSPFNILMPKEQLPIGARDGVMLCNIKKVPENRQSVNTTTDVLKDDDDPTSQKSPQELIVKVYALEDIVEKCSLDIKSCFNFNFINKNCVFVSDSLRITLKLKIGSRIIMEMIKEYECRQPTSLEIVPYTPMAEDLFLDYVKIYSKQEPLLLNSCSTLIFEKDEHCVIRISPENCDYTMIAEQDIKDLVIHVRPMIDCNKSFTLEKFYLCKEIPTSSTRFIFENTAIALNLSLGLQRMDLTFDRENILIYGDIGSGKTTICKLLNDDYSRSPYFVHSHMISCRSLIGKSVQTIEKIITPILKECLYYQPSILFLDDLESITSNLSDNEEKTAEAMNAFRITEFLRISINQYQECHNISVIATCVHMNKIGLTIRPARGVHFFKTVLQIPSLNKTDRINILSSALNNNLNDMNWDYYGNKTQGWTPQDLVDLAQKAIFTAYKRHDNKSECVSPPVVMEEDINKVLTNFVPISMQDVKLYKHSSYSWSDIGGLDNTKNSLLEILQWPLKYPEIFMNAPIKLQSGVLLYGMPGTGKTLLGKAIANECGVNLISIKGPELLSKYIGASEESVRNVFERARRAAPCVLFFDEFDSLAPRRGHDNSGVTDRVVNQLLTQLDGIEDRKGVAVVAASSRPDLLDPALLRPGRIDKLLYCPLPNKVDRKAIFAALCASHNINKEDLNIKDLVSLSSDFTGADIKAAITQAKLLAYEELTRPEDEIDEEIYGEIRTPKKIHVTQTHLVNAIKLMRPSLSAAEKKRYKSIYDRFMQKDTCLEEIKNQKATLA